MGLNSKPNGDLISLRDLVWDRIEARKGDKRNNNVLKYVYHIILCVVPDTHMLIIDLMHQYFSRERPEFKLIKINIKTLDI